MFLRGLIAYFSIIGVGILLLIHGIVLIIEMYTGYSFLISIKGMCEFGILLLGILAIFFCFLVIFLDFRDI